MYCLLILLKQILGSQSIRLKEDLVVGGDEAADGQGHFHLVAAVQEDQLHILGECAFAEIGLQNLGDPIVVGIGRFLVSIVGDAIQDRLTLVGKELRFVGRIRKFFFPRILRIWA